MYSILHYFLRMCFLFKTCLAQELRKKRSSHEFHGLRWPFRPLEWVRLCRCPPRMSARILFHPQQQKEYSFGGAAVWWMSKNHKAVLSRFRVSPHAIAPCSSVFYLALKMKLVILDGNGECFDSFIQCISDRCYLIIIWFVTFPTTAMLSQHLHRGFRNEDFPWWQTLMYSGK